MKTDRDSPERQCIRSVSIVIPARNAEGTLRRQLVAIARQHCSLPTEIIVVNHRSTDGTGSIIDQCSESDDRIVRLDYFSGRGVSAARNAGIGRSCGDLIVICDADDEVQEGWLASVIDVARDSDLVGGYLDIIPLNPELVYRFERSLTDAGLPQGPRILPYAVGANMAIRREVIEHIGLFNDDYVRGADEIEFCWRAQLAGFVLLYAPDARISYQLKWSLVPSAKSAFYSGLAFVRLYRDFRDKDPRANGIPQRSIPQAIKLWGSLLLRLPELATARRLSFVKTLFYSAGCVWGSLKFRVRYL